MSKLIIAPISFTNERPVLGKVLAYQSNKDTHHERFEKHIAASQRYANKQRVLFQSTRTERLSLYLNCMPHIKCIEFKMDNRFIGMKELGALKDLEGPNHKYSCEKILPMLLGTLANTTLQITKLLVHSSDDGWDGCGIMPHSARRKPILSSTTIKTAFCANPSKPFTGFSKLEHLNIRPHVASCVDHYALPVFNAIQNLLEYAPRLKTLTLQSITSRLHGGPVLSDLLPRVQYAGLSHLVLHDFEDTD